MIICILTVLLLLINPSVSATIDENLIVEHYLTTDMESLRILARQASDTTAAGQLLHGLFESDALVALSHYNQAIYLKPGSRIESLALERLFQYHFTLGNKDSAKHYGELLQKRYPGYKGWGVLSWQSIQAYNSQNESETKWTVQFGAFSSRPAAEKFSRQLIHYGKIEYYDKLIDGRQLTTVRMGMFDSRDDAEQFANQINNKTGIKGQPMIIG